MKLLKTATLAAAAVCFGLFCGSRVDDKVDGNCYPNFAIDFVDSKNGWLVGPRVLVTRDQGKSWEVITYTNKDDIVKADDGPEYRKYYVDFVDESWGWRVNPTRSAALQSTNDGGRSWQDSCSIKGATGLTGLYFLSRERGWAFGDAFYTTRDGGSTWFEVGELKDMELYHPFFLDQKFGWVAGRKGKIARTRNGGESWVVYSQFPQEARFVFFINELEGWAVGENGMVASSVDGGEHWRTIGLPLAESKRPDFLGVFFLNADLGWLTASNGQVAITRDGGKSWTVVQTPSTAPLASVFFVDAARGWVVGGNPEPAVPGGIPPSNVILQTSDGGYTWHRLETHPRASSCSVTEMVKGLEPPT